MVRILLIFELRGAQRQSLIKYRPVFLIGILDVQGLDPRLVVVLISHVPYLHFIGDLNA